MIFLRTVVTIIVLMGTLIAQDFSTRHTVDRAFHHTTQQTIQQPLPSLFQTRTIDTNHTLPSLSSQQPTSIPSIATTSLIDTSTEELRLVAMIVAAVFGIILSIVWIWRRYTRDDGQTTRSLSPQSHTRSLMLLILRSAKTLQPYASHFLIFLLIFSFFNDNFMVETLGGASLKIVFIAFLLFYTPTFIQNFRYANSRQYHLFYLFFITQMLLLLFEILAGWEIDYTQDFMMLIAVFAVILFFSQYPLEKTLMMLWVTMIVSVIVCHFNKPLDEWTFRTSGGTQDPNEFATQLLAFFFASWYLFTRNKSKIFILISSVFFLYGLFKAGSMSSFLALGVIGSLSLGRLIFLYPKLFFNPKTFTLLFFALVAATQVDPTKITAINNMLNRTKDTGTADFRMHSWVAGKHMIENNPLLGVGINAFGENEDEYEEGHLVGSSPQPHNVYIKIASESGVPTFLIFILFVGYTLLSHIRQLFWTPYWLVLSMLMTTLMMALTLGFLYDKYFWLIIAVVMNVNYLTQRKEDRL